MATTDALPRRTCCATVALILRSTATPMAARGTRWRSGSEDFEGLDDPTLGLSDTPQQLKGPSPHRFRVQQAAEFTAGPPATWHVRGLLPQAELVVLYGGSESDKSFVMLDLAVAVALGKPWRDPARRDACESQLCLRLRRKQPGLSWWAGAGWRRSLIHSAGNRRRLSVPSRRRRVGHVGRNRGFRRRGYRGDRYARAGHGGRR